MSKPDARSDGVAGVDRMWDSQWVNVVNHDDCYDGWGMTDAIAHAVKLTEQYMAANAESRITLLQDSIAAMLAERNALQARLDGVLRLADEMRACFDSKDIHVPIWHRLYGMPDELRAALGGESPASDEVGK